MDPEFPTTKLRSLATKTRDRSSILLNHFCATHGAEASGLRAGAVEGSLRSRSKGDRLSAHVGRKRLTMRRVGGGSAGDLANGLFLRVAAAGALVRRHLRERRLGDNGRLLVCPKVSVPPLASATSLPLALVYPATFGVQVVMVTTPALGGQLGTGRSRCCPCGAGQTDDDRTRHGQCRNQGNDYWKSTHTSPYSFAIGSATIRPRTTTLTQPQGPASSSPRRGVRSSS